MLTDRACREAKGRDKPYKLGDAFGLYLYVTSAGYRSWRWKYRHGGKEKRLTFGPYPDVSLQEARDRRGVAAHQLRWGIDPAAEKQRERAARVAEAEATFKSVAEDWQESQGPLWSPRHAQDVRRSLERDVYPKIGSIPVAAITTPLVLDVLRPIEQRGSVETAHRTRQRISEVFARAIGCGLAENDPAWPANRALAPAKRSKFPAVRRVEDARAVLRAVEAGDAHPTTKLASRLLALTAVRPGALRWAEQTEFEGLGTAAPIWRIPAAKMKLVVHRKENDAFEFIVPLSRQAVETVEVAMALAGNDPLLFRSARKSTRPIADDQLSKPYRDAGYQGTHVPHGWRSTFSTVMNELAAIKNRVGDRAVIDLMLAHVPSGVEPTYNRASYMPRRRELAQEWADMLTHDLPHPVALLGLDHA